MARCGSVLLLALLCIGCPSSQPTDGGLDAPTRDATLDDARPEDSRADSPTDVPAADVPLVDAPSDAGADTIELDATELDAAGPDAPEPDASEPDAGSACGDGIASAGERCCTDADRDALLGSLIPVDASTWAACIGPGAIGDPATTGATFCDTAVARCDEPACALSPPGTTFTITDLGSDHVLTVAMRLDDHVPLDARISGTATACSVHLTGDVSPRVVFGIEDDGTRLRLVVREVTFTTTLSGEIESGCPALTGFVADLLDQMLLGIVTWASEHVGDSERACDF